MISSSIFPYEEMDKLPKQLCDIVEDQNRKRAINSNVDSFKKKRKVDGLPNFESHNESKSSECGSGIPCNGSDFSILCDELQTSSTNTPRIFIDKQCEGADAEQPEVLHSTPEIDARYDVAKIISTSDSKKKSRRKAKGRPKGRKTSRHPHLTRPKRPRSAYNFFFQEERNNVLRDAGVITNATPSITGTKPDPEYFQISFKDNKSDDETSIRKRGRPRGENYRPRKKLEGHGLVKFNDLAKMVGGKWKSLDSEAKQPFEELARIELVHYQDAMKRYNEEIKKFESPSDSGSDQEISLDLSISSAGGKPQHFKPTQPFDQEVGHESEDVLPPLDVGTMGFNVNNLPLAKYLIDFAGTTFFEDNHASD
mmetsp:Transcript_12506/g.19351  ORF Transcript_12506/g.19351 Transcript_12506/m.19351 type:complete len:367 (+) Transcript_12506:78-1178(+)